MKGVNGKVLLIEDDLAIAETIREVLQYEGYAVECASNALDALIAVEADRPELIVLDMILPGLSGAEFLTKLGARIAPTSIPVIAMSASADIWSAPGARDFIRKPLDIERLLELVAKHIVRT